MPASIALSNITWSTPDGRRLFSNLDLNFGPERTGLVGRNGIGKTSLLHLIDSTLHPQSGKVTVTGTLGILRQTVAVNQTETIAGVFGVAEALDILRRAEMGQATAADLVRADWTLKARMTLALDLAGLDSAPDTRLATLSGGQRTRAGLAALIFAQPDFLLLDEPTNNLDREGRRAVLDLLAKWRTGAIVISHDRELLETMDAIVELTSLGAKRYGGNWSCYRACKAGELETAQRDLAQADRRIAEIARDAQIMIERKARKDSAGRKKRAKGDTPRILLGKKKNRSENTSGGNARLVESRSTQALEAAAAARKRIEVLQPFSVQLAPTGLAPDKPVLQIDAVRVGYESGPLVLSDLSFAIIGPERIAVTGPNGSGKTTFLALVSGTLPPISGTVRVMTDFAMLDQKVSVLDPALSIRDNFRRLNPGTDENSCRAALARFMFRADAALQAVASLSGGQVLRAGLACTLGGPKTPSLLILDEPTNHLDIESIEIVEAGLRAYDGALLVISHDETFLANINITRRFHVPSSASA